MRVRASETVRRTGGGASEVPRSRSRRPRVADTGQKWPHTRTRSPPGPPRANIPTATSVPGSPRGSGIRPSLSALAENPLCGGFPGDERVPVRWKVLTTGGTDEYPSYGSDGHGAVRRRRMQRHGRADRTRHRCSQHAGGRRVAPNRRKRARGAGRRHPRVHVPRRGATRRGRNRHLKGRAALRAISRGRPDLSGRGRRHGMGRGHHPRDQRGRRPARDRIHVLRSSVPPSDVRCLRCPRCLRCRDPRDRRACLPGDASLCCTLIM